MQEHRSIEQLENDYWKDASFPSSLVEKCFNYLKIPVSELTVEQLRLLIGQRIGLSYVIPKAVCYLQTNVLAEGDFYPGDLLNSLLGLSEEDWKQIPNEKHKVIELLRHNILTIEATGNIELIRNTKTILA